MHKDRTPKEVLACAKSEGVKLVDLKFVDFVGQWQHKTHPLHEFDEGTFENGLGFDGSSIRGWKSIDNSDMLQIPDARTAFIDPFCDQPTLSLICNVVDPITREAYSRDPRQIAQKAANYVKLTGIADTATWVPRPSSSSSTTCATRRTSTRATTTSIPSRGSGTAASDESPNLGNKPRYKEGYFPVPPIDTQQDIRSEMVLQMEELGIVVETHHHEVATAGQAEIDMRFAPIVDMADQLMVYKYVTKNVARRAGKVVTFMPKPLFGDNGSGMHTHQSLWKDGKPLFAGNEYAGSRRCACTTSAGS